MLILISPAKTLDFESSIIQDFNTSKPYFYPDAIQLVEILSKKSAQELEKIMGISTKLANLNFERFQSFQTARTRAAIFAYKGDVYEGFDLASYSLKDLEFANQTLRIISGLYGVLKPLDEIAPYRLEMSTSIQNPQGKDLYRFWNNKLTDFLNKENAKYVINLASNEYYSAIGKLNPKVINIVFRDKGKIVGILAKKARGLMANYIILHRIDNPESLKEFNLSGYKFSAADSSEFEYVFVR